MQRDALPLDRRLRQELLFARERVYRFGSPTPLERIVLPGPGPEIWVKREDLSPIKAYKWRGACNRMAVLSPEETSRGVVTASAGNHAQGVALAAARLGISARIYMPRSTPRVKQEAVRQLGGNRVEIHLAGDSYDEAVAEARADEQATGAVYVNFLTQDEGDRVRTAYGENYDRLVQLKNKYDPTNLFRMNQNIQPSGRG